MESEPLPVDKWKTRDGRIIDISAMDSRHIVNAALLITKRFSVLIAELEKRKDTEELKQINTFIKATQIKNKIIEEERLARKPKFNKKEINAYNKSQIKEDDFLFPLDLI